MGYWKVKEVGLANYWIRVWEQWWIEIMLTCPFLLFFDNKNQNPNICPIKKEKKNQIPNIYTTAMSLQTKVVVSVMWQGEKNV